MSIETTDAPCLREPTYDELESVRRLRSLLDEERQRPIEEELTAADHDPSNVHMAVFLGEHVVSYARFDRSEAGALYTVTKVITAPRYRRLGFASKVLLEGERLVRERGARMMQLSARLPAVNTYARIGYVSDGEPYLSKDGVVNLKMKKRLV